MLICWRNLSMSIQCFAHEPSYRNEPSCRKRRGTASIPGRNLGGKVKGEPCSRCQQWLAHTRCCRTMDGSPEKPDGGAPPRGRTAVAGARRRRDGRWNWWSQYCWHRRTRHEKLLFQCNRLWDATYSYQLPQAHQAWRAARFQPLGWKLQRHHHQGVEKSIEEPQVHVYLPMYLSLLQLINRWPDAVRFCNNFLWIAVICC